MKKNKLHGVWIPIDLLTSSNLSKTALLLLSDMANFQQYYKSRKEIASLLKVDKNYVSKLLQDLEKKGYIEQVGNVFNRKVYAISKETKISYEKKNSTPQIKYSQEELERMIQRLHQMLGGTRKLNITPGRLSKIKRRLLNFEPDELLKAAYNLSQSEFHMGKNDNGMKYATVDFLLRNDEQVEKWLNTEIVNNRINNLSRSVF